MLVAIEGNIGAGKTTLLRELRESLPASFSCLEEPLDAMIVPTVPPVNILEKYYEDPKNKAFEFQVTMLTTRLRLFHAALAGGARNVVAERSLLGDRLFATVNAREKNMEMYQLMLYEDILEFWRDTFPQIFPSKIIYLRTPVATCMERISRRGRNEEVGISRSYIQTLHDAHERAVAGWRADGIDVLTLDGDIPINEFKFTHVRAVGKMLGAK